jgi:LAO/AO transport system kinase
LNASSSGLVERVLGRDPAAVARAISLVEDRRPASEDAIVNLLSALRGAEAFGRSLRVGITGPPGVGKSSLISLLGRTARATGRSVGVLAVDPSSPRSGGALLGDRARIELDPDDAGFFLRSMASGGELGGLARAAGAAVDVLSAAYDLVLIETTGVGQSETDVEHVADFVVVVIQPASGDVLQFLKAGILEIPDVFVINKADLGDVAERSRADLAAALSAIHVGGSRASPVVMTSVRTGQGIDELLSAIDEQAKLFGADELSERRALRGAAWAERLFLQRYGEVGVERSGGAEVLRRELLAAIRGGASSVEAVWAIGRRLVITIDS